MHIELSFPSTNFRDYLEFRQKNDKLTKEGILGAEVPKPKPKGGKVTIVNWHSKNVAWEAEAPTPAGFVIDQNKLRICDELGDRVVSINNSHEITDFFSHPYFNYPHDIDHIGDNFLVTSTGLDAILEFDRNGQILFQWHGQDWGYDETPTGKKRSVDLSQDHRGVRYATLDRAAHINSAIYMDGGETLLTTFFHKGELVMIEKTSGAPTIIADGLDHPHAVHRGPDGTYIFSETGLNKVHILDPNLKPLKTYENEHGCEWIQDSVFSPKGTILIGDANKSTILEVTFPEFKLIDQYKYDANWKLFKIGVENEEEIARFIESAEAS